MAPAVTEALDTVPQVEVPMPVKENGTTTRTRRHEEHQYLDLVQEILDDGEHRPDR